MAVAESIACACPRWWIWCWNRCLSTPEFGKRWTWNAVCKSLWPKPSTLQRVDNEQVDDVNVVQRLLQAREEAGPLGFKRLLVQVCASREQPVVRPGVIVGECAVRLDKTGGHVCSLALRY